MKKELTQDDNNRLDAARCLDLEMSIGGRQHFNGTGLKPSVEVYNKAVKMGIYTGALIMPIGSNE